MSDTRRLYINNWAILAVKGQIRWHFGDISEDKLVRTISFVNALSTFGNDVLGQGIGLIRLKYPRPHPTRANEIMVVNLMDTYYIVVSDPLVTTRLMNKIEMDDPIPPFDDLRSILAGAASVIYSEFYTQDEEVIESRIVDSLFKEAVNAVTLDNRVTVGKGECSFSSLTIEELLFFHALLKDLFESYISVTFKNKPWGIMAASAGAPIHLEEGNPPADSALMTSLSSVIIDYCKFLFDATPSRLIFGIHPMMTMDFITTEHNFIILNDPRTLIKSRKFTRKWKKLPREVSYDLAPEMKKYFAELLGQEYQERVKQMKFHHVINSLTKIGIKRAREYVLPTIKLAKEKMKED